VSAIRYDDVWLLGGMRTPFVDYNGALRDVSPTDLGILAARAALAKVAFDPALIDAVVAANVAQSSFDAYYVPRHIGLYSGVPVDVPALGVNRICGSGFETIATAADNIQLGKASAILCVGTESMSRNPVASYTSRGGFRMGGVEFADFLWEATLDTAPGIRMGDTAERLAIKYGIDRGKVDEFAAQSFTRAVAARERGYFTDEIVSVEAQVFSRTGFSDRSIQTPRATPAITQDSHPRETSVQTLAKLTAPFAGGIQTGGNSAAIVDGAAAVIISSSRFADERSPLARIVAASTVGVPPDIMGIGPAPAIRQLLEHCDLTLADIARFEINEAFGAQYLAVERELGLDRSRVNVNGGAIALGHPLAATGTRCALTVARELRESGERYGIASACAGGGQGIALLLENPLATHEIWRAARL